MPTMEYQTEKSHGTRVKQEGPTEFISKILLDAECIIPWN